MSFINDFQKTWTKLEVWQKIFSILAILATSFLVVLAIFVRPAADDYCSFIDISNIGLAGYIPYYFSTINGRISSGLMNIVIYGPQSLIILIVLSITSIILFIFAINFFVKSHQKIGYSLLLQPFVAMVAILLSFNMLIDPYQFIMWSPGIISYTLPFIGLILLFAWGAKQKDSPKTAFLVFMAGIIVGLSNELIAIYAAGMAIMYGIIFYGLKRTMSKRNLSVLFVSQVISFFIIYFSPGSSSRRQFIGSSLHDSIGNILSQSFHIFAGIASSRLLSWATVGLVVLGVFTAWLWYKNLSVKKILWASSWLILGALISLYGAVVISLYSYNSAPPGRMTAIPLILMSFGIVLLSQGFCWLLMYRLQSIGRHKNIFIAVSLLPACIAIFLVAVLGHRIIERHAVWEQQNTRLSPIGIEGRNIYAALPTYVLDGVGDIESEKMNWIETCQQYYYD